MFNKVKEYLEIFKMVKKLNLVRVKEVLSVLIKSDRCIILHCGEENATAENIECFTADDNVDVDFIFSSLQAMKTGFIRMIGEQSYSENLEKYDYDLAMAYKEADFQMMRADVAELETQYVKEINNPSGGMKGPQLYSMWNALQQKKQILENFN